MRITNVEFPPVGSTVTTRRGIVTIAEGDVKVTLEDGSCLVPKDARERQMLSYASHTGRSVEGYGIEL